VSTPIQFWDESHKCKEPVQQILLQCNKDTLAAMCETLSATASKWCPREALQKLFDELKVIYNRENYDMASRKMFAHLCTVASGMNILF
jgi:hypothetical protein